MTLTAEMCLMEPTCYTQAARFSKWCEAMDLDFNALLQNNTWRLVLHCLGMNVIGCKWVCHTKCKADGSIERHKAQLVPKGFDMFSLVVKPTTMRLLLSLALSFDWTIRQLDVHNAFLNSSLAETAHMCQPPGYVDKDYLDHICFLQCSL